MKGDEALKELKNKILEALVSALPITAIVYLMALTPLFDFSGVEFMDSSGIGVIMGRYKQMSYVGGTVYVYGIGKNVDRIFQMSGLYKLVKQWNQAEVE